MKHARLAILVGLLILLGLIIGCSPSQIDISGAGAPITVGPGATTGGSIIVTLTDVTSGATVTSIPSSGSVNVNATVTDSSKNLISGATVSFAVGNATAGSLATPTATTNASGVATVQFNANAVNMIVTITASVTTGGSTANNSATLTIGTPPPPVPAHLTIAVTPMSVNIQGTATVTATVTDSGGNAAYNTPITLDIVTAGTVTGSFSPTSTVSSLPLTTDTSGQASATFYAGGASGTVTIRATVAGTLIVKTTSISITSSPSSVSVTISPNTINTSATANISASVVNMLGQAVPDGTQVSFSCFAGACAPAIGTFAAVATTVSGTASVTFTASAATTGSAIISACAGTSVCNTAQITVNAAATGSIEFVSAVPQVIGIQGSGPNDNGAVTFLVKDSNGTPKPNVLVDFLLFGPTGAYIGNTSGSTTDSGSTGADGKVAIILHAGLVAGPARIEATVNGTTITTSSGNISIGGGVPSATHFDLATSQFNLEGFAYNNIQATITAYLADRFGNYNVLKGTSVSFYTEAGAIDTAAKTDAAGLAPVVFRTQDPRPNDVDPIATELYYTQVDVVSGATHTYNPRDGRVTILATTTGEESFVDNNANGFYDAGDTFTDIGEPFIDSNDNGVRDVGEQFFDWPSYVPGGTPGTYQGGNGGWDGNIPIWKSINLVFTGPPSTGITATSPAYPQGKLTSRIECTDSTISPLLYGDVTIPNGESRTFWVYVSDFNMNTLINGTTIDVKQLTGAKGALTTPTPITLADVLSEGPTAFPVKLRNDITGTTDQSGDFYVEVTWKGIKYDIYYPGSITLTRVTPKVSNVTLASGTVGTSYTEYLMATGGTSPYISWAVIAGSLPPGLTLPSGGFINVIGGTPTAAGTYNFTVQVTDTTGATGTKALSIVIAP